MEKGVLKTLAKIVGGSDKLVEIYLNIDRVKRHCIENQRIIKLKTWDEITPPSKPNHI